MSEQEPRSGFGPGCAIGAAFGLVVLVAAGILAVRMGSSEPPKPASSGPGGALPPPPPPPPVTPQIMSAPGKPVAIKLTALGDRGTWYMIDEDICEGDAALTALIKDRMARDRAAKGNPADYSYPVRLEVAPDTGITDKHLAAARQAAAAAGATVVEDPKPAAGEPAGKRAP